MCQSLRVAAFSIDVAREEGTTVISVSGALDLNSVPTLLEGAKAVLGDRTANGLVLDFANVDFLDSTGLGCLVEIRQVAEDAGKPVALRAVPAATARVIELGGLSGIFDVLPAPAD
jgi:anti-anti-sigma factor